ncbi:Peroxisomal hydratase-dehydrogenase-epimerase [Cyphellophora attinorum]|uniref:Peroxisomal hydratase-dehydrogenase-epimerase n=1 Tax=Cyphellophora attinorum TaxID=1664694 RepID=A0A0N1H4P4_9EURO|nr:Peroxisomal hydratase-dehydrogenase-epimerase [Phialophora attinorum]KPI40313.1 Peroxisomal hydratase-dehydrogenase-epimerase [Phialophora attinorum]
MAQNEIRYDDQVVVITGAGAGLGRAYALFFAARGAKVVVNDLGGTFNGAAGSSAKVADTVVSEITSAGGTAVANYSAVQQGDEIIATAIKHFGRVDVLINNAGILRDVTLRNMKDEDWDRIIDVHVTGTMMTTKAAWAYMRKQRFGRVVNTSSASGLFGNFGQSNYAAAKMAIVGFTETLALEGKKYNITANILAPGAASRLTRTVWSEDMMEVMKPDWVVPLVGSLVHASCNITGTIFEAAAGHFSAIRWERSRGLLLEPESMTVEDVLAGHAQIADFKDAEHPKSVANSLEKLEASRKQPVLNQKGHKEKVSFKGKVILVTGAGEGLGRAYAKLFAERGGKVVVNDVVGAEKVAADIRAAGGEAIANTTSVEKGDQLVKETIETYGRIDVLVNNAGILRDKAFMNMTAQQWHEVMNVHLRGTFLTCRAAFPHFLKQRSGRIVNITSTSGIYGSFGQANYAAAKCGIVGFSKTLSREGAKYNIIVNAVAPSAGTNMTRTVRSEEEVQLMKPEYVAPLVAALCCERPPGSGGLYEVGTGWFAMTRWQRARGVDFEHAKGVVSVEEVMAALPEICNFDNGKADNPDDPQEGSKYTMGNVLKNPKIAGALSQQNRGRRGDVGKAKI